MHIKNDTVARLLLGTPLPRMFRVRQNFPRDRIAPEAIPGMIDSLLGQDGLATTVRPGMRVAITAGSRGIANAAAIIRSLAGFISSRGASPFVVPAMGSHGGATAEGQVELLAELGITEESVGCPIISSMETVKVGVTETGVDVFMDRNAAEADGVVVFCRVKPHTDFRGPYESGIMKMLAIGLGKQQGAEYCHNEGMGKMPENIPLFGNAVLASGKILFAVAVIENAYDETCRIHALPPDRIAKEEPELLSVAWSLMPKILVPECDLLIIDQIGKNFSGCGMDPNITGTFYTPGLTGGIRYQRVCVLDISDESHGNFSGLGVCDATTRRVFDKVDTNSTYTNAVTCKILADAKIPAVMNNDRECIQLCIKTLVGLGDRPARVVRIANSLHIGTIWLSEAYLETARRHPEMEVLTEPRELAFAANGDLEQFH